MSFVHEVLLLYAHRKAAVQAHYAYQTQVENELLWSAVQNDRNVLVGTSMLEKKWREANKRQALGTFTKFNLLQMLHVFAAPVQT